MPRFNGDRRAQTQFKFGLNQILIFFHHATSATPQCQAPALAVEPLPLCFMIRTRDSRVRKQDTSRPFSCPFRGCYRSFKRISARTQHIRLCHGGNPSPLPIPSTPARINPTLPSPHHPRTAASAAEPSQHPSVSPLHAPQFSTPNDPTPSLYSTPTTGPSFESVCGINTDDVYPSVSPLLESSTSTLAIPNLTSPYSPLGYAFESESSLDVDGDQIVPTHGPFHFESSPVPESLQFDLGPDEIARQDIGQRLSSSPHPPSPRPVRRGPGHMQDGRNAEPTMKTFHPIINGAFSKIILSILLTNGMLIQVCPVMKRAMIATLKLCHLRNAHALTPKIGLHSKIN